MQEIKVKRIFYKKKYQLRVKILLIINTKICELICIKY